MRRALLALAVALGLALALTFDLRRVGDEEMSPSLQVGDWLLMGPGEPRVGDVVLLEDPSDPGRDRLRRVVAFAPSQVAHQAGALRVDGLAWRYREMGRDADHMVLSEQNGWLVRHQLRPLRGPEASDLLPPGHLWVLADDRDLGVDSRWWGPVPQADVRGVLWLRVGSEDAWRRAWTWRGVDGPWLPPSKRGAAGR